LLIVVLANILLFYIKDEELVDLIIPINTIDMLKLLHDITNFEIINEREMDGTIVVDNN